MRVAGLLLATATLIACGSHTDIAAPQSSAGTVGLIVARDRGTSIGGPPTIHVKSNATEECGVVFLVRSTTRIVRRTSTGRVVAGSLADLTVGHRVSVWTDGVVLRSCPGQGVATAVEVAESTN